MKDFHANGTVYVLDASTRDNVKPGWYEMLEPARDRIGVRVTIPGASTAVLKAENVLTDHNHTLVGNRVLEVGCNEGVRSYIMAKYQDTTVHGIDVLEYTVEQSPDMNGWNPEDSKFVGDRFNFVQNELGTKFPPTVSRKVSFSLSDVSFFKTDPDFDIVISWDTLEHILDLPTGFKRMYEALKPGGIAYHAYNPFFAVNGGHSLCTLDFLFGHCRLTSEDFERYIREVRPQEEKIDINFYHKCLNRASIADVKKCAVEAGFEILFFKGLPAFAGQHAMWQERIEKEFLPETKAIYPTVTNEDLFYGEIEMVLRKK